MPFSILIRVAHTILVMLQLKPNSIRATQQHFTVAHTIPVMLQLKRTL